MTLHTETAPLYTMAKAAAGADNKTKKATKASKAKKATKAMKAKKDEDTLTFTQEELAALIAEHLFFGLGGTKDARSWDQCDYEGDLVADRIWYQFVRSVRHR